MNIFKERLLENDLAEMLGGKRPPDLTQEALARLAGTSLPRESTGRRLPDATQGRTYKPRLARRNWMRLLEAACIVAAFGVMAWLLWPGDRNEQLPASVVASPDAKYAVSKTAIKLDKGWLLLAEGAPLTVIGDGRVGAVKGRVMVKVGDVPTQSELNELGASWPSELTEEEKTMLMNPKNWMAAGTMAVCLLGGTAVVNGEEKIWSPEIRVDHKIDQPMRGGDDVLPAKVDEFRVISAYNGDNSDIDETEFHLIRNSSDLLTVLSRHKKEGWDKQPVDADFKNEMIIAIFLGKRVNTYDVKIESTFKTSQRYVLRYYATTFTSGEARSTTPFGFFVVNKTAVRVALEERVITRAFESTRWEQRHQFDQGAGVVPALLKEEGILKTHTATDSKARFRVDARGFDPIAAFRLIKSATEFDDLWREHAPDNTKPWNVDFDKQMVLAVFCPSTMNSDGLKLEDTLVNSKTRVLRLNNDIDLRRSAAGFSRPCAFYLLAKDNRETVIEMKNHYKEEGRETVTRNQNDPEQWVEIGRVKEK